MGYMDVMMQMGAVPKGFKPIPKEGTPSELFEKSMQKIIAQEEDIINRDLEKKKKKFDMYKTLRESGYDSYRAFKAVQSGVEMPEPLAEDTPLPERTTKKVPTLEESIKTKVAEGQDLTAGEQKLYNDTIKRAKSNSGSLAEILAGEDDDEETPVVEEFINVVSPDGKNGKFKKSVWEKRKVELLKKGYKKR